MRCCLRKILEMLWNYKDIHFRLQTFAENQKSGSALAKPLRKPYIANKTKNRSSFEKRSFGLSDRIWTCGLYHPKVIFDVLQFFAVFNERRCYAVYRHFTFYPILFRMAHFHHDGALMAHSESPSRKKEKPPCSPNGLTKRFVLELGMGLEFSTRLFQQFSVGWNFA